MTDDQAVSTWPAMPVSARNYFLRIARIIQNKFPYCKQIFVFSRCYSGYAEVGSLQDEPSTYWQGYSVKWMIGAQTRYSTPVDSVSYLKTCGYSGNAPWFDWLTYNWANGSDTHTAVSRPVKVLMEYKRTIYGKTTPF